MEKKGLVKRAFKAVLKGVSGKEQLYQGGKGKFSLFYITGKRAIPCHDHGLMKPLVDFVSERVVQDLELKGIVLTDTEKEGQSILSGIHWKDQFRYISGDAA